MASVTKCTNNEVYYHLRHNSRENPRTPGNPDIDPERREQNIFLSPEDHGRSARECRIYYKKRLSEIYVYGRADVITACEWVITAPKDLMQEKQEDFFRTSYEFLNSIYGEKNCVQAVVHNDEGVKDASGKIIEGKAHLHYLFIPAVKNKHYMQPNKAGNIKKADQFSEKLCAYELITKGHLQQFHPKLQKFLDEAGISCTVHSGVTGGKSRSVDELKHETKELIKEREQSKTLESENSQLREKLAQYEKTNEKTSGWSKSGSWGKEQSWIINR